MDPFYGDFGFMQGPGFGNRGPPPPPFWGGQGRSDSDWQRGPGDMRRGGGRGGGDNRKKGGNKGRRRPQPSDFEEPEDVVKRPPQNKKVKTQQVGSFPNLIESWQEFLRTFSDRGNAILNLECGITASKINSLKLSYESRPLIKVHLYHIFTGTLYLTRVSQNGPDDTILLSQGLGRNKKNAKLETYQRAYNLLLNGAVDEIMSKEEMEDRGLVEELMNLFNEDAYGFLDFLEKSNIQGEEGLRELLQSSRENIESVPELPSIKGRMLQQAARSTSKPMTQFQVGMSELNPLCDKLTKLKKLLKEKGITKLHIVPKIDQLGDEIDLKVLNVYHYSCPPVVGKENQTPLYCEIYFDDVLMSRGDFSLIPASAMCSAYTSLAQRLYKEPLASIVDESSTWTESMANDPGVCKVIIKRFEDKNDYPLSNNLSSLKQLMQCNPDFSVSIDQFVVMEIEEEIKIENLYRALQLSATYNRMLLECEIVGDKEQRFTCMMSMQGKPLSIRTSYSKGEAKRQCSDAILSRLTKTNDIVHVGSGAQGPVFTRTHLLVKAKKAKEAGMEPLKCKLKREQRKVPIFKTSEQKAQWAGNVREAREVDDLPENVADRPYVPWMGRILADYMLDYHKRFTLEDFQVNLQDMPITMRDMVYVVGFRLGLKVTQEQKEGKNIIMHRCLSALEVTKILGMNGGVCGRYRLKQCKNPWTVTELEEYKNQVIAKYTKMYEELLNDTDMETEPMIETEMD